MSKWIYTPMIEGKGWGIEYNYPPQEVVDKVVVVFEEFVAFEKQFDIEFAVDEETESMMIFLFDGKWMLEYSTVDKDNIYICDNSRARIGRIVREK